MTAIRDEYIAEAYDRGKQAAEAAATWVADGNTPAAHIRYVLWRIEEGDPRAEEYLPAMPNLSGEWADAPTPASLYEEITDRDAHADATWNQDAYQAVLEELCQAFERGVDATFEDACVTELRKWVA